MARERKGITGRMIDGSTRLFARAAETVMSDPRGQEAVARAVGMAQRGRRRLEEVQERMMRVAGIPGRKDYQDLAKQLARIKRKARELGDKLGPPSDGGGERGPQTH
jgi:hypothetical protein